MKNRILHGACTFTILGICFFVLSCASTDSNSKSQLNQEQIELTGLEAIPEEHLKQEFELSQEEEKALFTYNLESVSEYPHSEWIPMGETDGALVLNIYQCEDIPNCSIKLTLLQENRTSNISNSVLKARFYIPENFKSSMESQEIEFRIYIVDSNMQQHQIGGDLAHFFIQDTGTLWQTLVMDFKNQLFDFGEKKGTFYVNSILLKDCAALEIQFEHSSGAPIPQIPLILDWICIEEADF